ncbi:phenylacetate--CoA ligase family protein [Psychrobacter celer]|uniref:phenylacetate--CoA ligase family protein n=1 Tax=Psychrobacter celer TaxID=306572 RepID=UPI003FD5041A
MSILHNAFKFMPIALQNTAISLVNYKLYKTRHARDYNKYRNYYSVWDNATYEEVESERDRRLQSFLMYAKQQSEWYKNNISIDTISCHNLSEIPILEKKDILNNLKKIQTINDQAGIVSFTGGTTGASMKVVYAKNDTQERFAILDNFRAKYGYKLGKKTAWFSGKNLISEKDIKNGICSHYDFINKIRFYSTFHINKRNFDVYWKSLNEFKPEFIVGFPSSVYEICEIADSKGLRLNHKVKVFFPTAETVLPRHREVIGRVLGCKLVDQYASSEGAPFILECTKGNLHIHPLTGIFEVVDENMQLAEEGELLVTSFTTHGTPLIRYRVGDRIKLTSPDKKCDCGSIFPLVDRIQGRSTDYILSPTHGKVNLGNISNSTKDVAGIIQFQVIQQELNQVKVLVVTTPDFILVEKNKFKLALAERFGNQVSIDLQVVDEIAKEKSGKFRLVKNLII